MNFLAHLQLAENTPESRLGNLLGDFVRGFPWDNRYSEAIWTGIVEHRYVDAFTDTHESWRKSRDILPVEMRRFAGIIVDIFYDYFLHKHWDEFSPDQSLDDFVETVHMQLRKVLQIAPSEAAEAIKLMVHQDWLRQYASLEGIDITLRRVSHRSPVLTPIFGSAEILERNSEELESHFLEFYPDLVKYMPKIRAQIQDERTSAR